MLLTVFLLVVPLFLTSQTGVAAQTNITVDDSNPAISYVGGGWTTQAQGSAVNGSVHTTCGAVDGTATFNFTGVAIYYLPPSEPCSGAGGVTLTLDGAAIEVEAVTGLPLDPFGQTDLSNTLHTITIDSSNAGIDAFIYTAEEPDGVSSASPSSSGSASTSSSSASTSASPASSDEQSTFLSADAFSYSDGWTISTDPVPSCIKSGHVHQTSTVNATFTFNFTGEELSLNALASPTGGMLSLSINGEEPELFNTSASAASCASISLNATALVKRSLGKRGGGAADAQNQCIGKATSGKVAMDGATYAKETSGAGTRAFAPLSTLLVTLGFVTALGSMV